MNKLKEMCGKLIMGIAVFIAVFCIIGGFIVFVYFLVDGSKWNNSLSLIGLGAMIGGPIFSIFPFSHGMTVDNVNRLRELKEKDQRDNEYEKSVQANKAAYDRLPEL